MKRASPLSSIIVGSVIWMPVIVIAVAGQPTKETIPGSYEITSEDGVIQFPFSIHRGDIRFACQVNAQSF